MKKTTLLTFAVFLIFNSANAQVLYTENFNNYPVGNFGTDFTGTVPAQGGWYTYDHGAAPQFLSSDNADYQIVTEPNRGNILHLGYTNRLLQNIHQVYRADINTYWQQRTANNDVFKISFNIFTKDANDLSAHFTIENELKQDLFRMQYYATKRYLILSGVPMGQLKYSNGSMVVLPVDTWVTIEVYIDYTNSNLYISLPTLNNYTAMFKLDTLQLGGIDKDGNKLRDDSPVKFLFTGYGGTRLVSINPDKIDPKYDKPFRLRVDDINISAQNTVPTVNLNINEFLSNQFNLYPNPAKDLVTITNNDNMFVNQVKIYDLSGKLINTQNFNNEAEIQLNVENLTNGIYMLHFQTDQGIAVKKLIKK